MADWSLQHILQLHLHPNQSTTQWEGPGTVADGLPDVAVQASSHSCSILMQKTLEISNLKTLEKGFLFKEKPGSACTSFLQFSVLYVTLSIYPFSSFLDTLVPQSTIFTSSPRRCLECLYSAFLANFTLWIPFKRLGAFQTLISLFILSLIVTSVEFPSKSCSWPGTRRAPWIHTMQC